MRELKKSTFVVRLSETHDARIHFEDYQQMDHDSQVLTTMVAVGFTANV